MGWDFLEPKYQLTESPVSRFCTPLQVGIQNTVLSLWPQQVSLAEYCQCNSCVANHNFVQNKNIVQSSTKSLSMRSFRQPHFKSNQETSKKARATDLDISNRRLEAQTTRETIVVTNQRLTNQILKVQLLSIKKDIKRRSSGGSFNCLIYLFQFTAKSSKKAMFQIFKKVQGQHLDF